MSNLFIWIFILSVWNSILFFGCDYGVSVVLFIIPMISLIIYSLNKNKKIINKKGYLFIIPIILLSSTYFIFYNSFFRVFNVIVIPILINTMIMYLYGGLLEAKLLISNFFSILFKPLSCISNVINLLKLKRRNISNDKKKRVSKIFVSLIITIIVMGVIISLLSDADMIFASIFGNIAKFFEDVINQILDANIVARIITIIIFFIYFSSVMNYLLFNYSNKNIYINKSDNKRKNKDNYTLNMILGGLNIIYAIFDVIQVKSLFLHFMGNMSFTYAEYARNGFFQLMVVSIINFIIILVAKKLENSKNSKYVKIMSILMIFLTFIILVSSFMRIHLYEVHYGYTLLRLFVYIILITEGLLLIPTIIYIINDKFNLFKVYFVIVVSVYVIINYINMDNIIARENVNRYFNNDKIDTEYLLRLSYDSIYEIDRLYNNTDDIVIRKKIENYYKRSYYDLDDIKVQEFNISKYKAKKLVDKRR